MNTVDKIDLKRYNQYGFQFTFAHCVRLKNNLLHLDGLQSRLGEFELGKFGHVDSLSAAELRRDFVQFLLEIGFDLWTSKE